MNIIDRLTKKAPISSELQKKQLLGKIAIVEAEAVRAEKRLQDAKEISELNAQLLKEKERVLKARSEAKGYGGRDDGSNSQRLAKIAIYVGAGFIFFILFIAGIRSCL